MLTFTLQCAFALGLVAVAAFAAVIARRAAGTVWQRAGWSMVASAFTLFSVDVAAQLSFGGLAMATGRTSAIMTAYLLVTPLLNHSRTFLMLAAAVLLVWLALRRREPGPEDWMITWAALGAGLVVGAAVGLAEGGFIPAVHYTAVAEWDLVELVVLLVTLFVLLKRDRIDRYLWTLLAVYALSVALGIFWETLQSQFGRAGMWYPPIWTLAAVRAGFFWAMAAIALSCWRAVNAGQRLRSFVEPLRMRPAHDAANLPLSM
jgi:hypothetical protein